MNLVLLCFVGFFKLKTSQKQQPNRAYTPEIPLTAMGMSFYPRRSPRHSLLPCCPCSPSLELTQSATPSTAPLEPYRGDTECLVFSMDVGTTQCWSSHFSFSSPESDESSSSNFMTRTQTTAAVAIVHCQPGQVPKVRVVNRWPSSPVSHPPLFPLLPFIRLKLYTRPELIQNP